MSRALLSWLLMARAVDVKEGDCAPKIESTDDAGKVRSSKDHVGMKALVVFFFSGAFEPSSTPQACEFRDDMKSSADVGRS